MLLYESDLVFDFEETAWVVKKYDEHPYYKRLSGRGLKGVDFIGIFQEQQVVFIEVKHFRSRHPTLQEEFAVLATTKQFIGKMADKMEDTFKVLQAVAAYLRKKWWYRLFLTWEAYLPLCLLKQQDWFFWHQVHELAQDRSTITFVLWLEIEEGISKKGKLDLAQYIDDTLTKELIEFTDTVIVASMQQPVYEEHLRVRNEK